MTTEEQWDAHVRAEEDWLEWAEASARAELWEAAQVTPR